ncbi:MAG: YabP/YqfC family sporulation protein [Oscillospiraceae bacterium]|nr:YabP/YqfC family sporulation protein [Oscillospiraceae bacterium]
MQETTGKPAEHAVTITDRAQVALCGIEEVGSYDAGGILMKSSLGELVIRGEGLRIKSFDRVSGKLLIEGKVSALQYAEQREKGEGLFARLFG